MILQEKGLKIFLSTIVTTIVEMKKDRLPGGI